MSAPSSLFDDPAAADLARCAATLRGGSKSFHAAARVLPRRVRDDAIALYAFCRVADDAIDLAPDDPAAVRAALADLQRRLDALLAGQPAEQPADRAFATVVRRHAMPRALPAALLEGFAWDAQRRRYDTLAQLHDYAARVAGAVGAMMALIMGVRDRALLARACDLGVAMQLTNIARDVGEDAAAGRLYLPQDWLRAAHIDPDGWLAAPRFTPALAGVVNQLLSAADELYRRASLGIDRLPLTCRPSMHAARLLYAEIGREVERRGGDSVTQRAVVARARKRRLLIDALRMSLVAGSGMPSIELSAPPLPATRFLVDAVPAPSSDDASGSRIGWLVDLFERLEQRERALAESRAPAR